MTHQPAIRASDAEREAAVVRLRDAAAEGRLTLTEFADRVDAAYAARDRDELDVLSADLPLPATPSPAATGGRRWVVAVMSDTRRRGRWRVGERTTAVAVMGNLTVDLREAVLSTTEVTISVFVWMGNARVIVPKGVSVDVGGISVMGNKLDRTHRPERPDAPHVSISGLVAMGNLVVANG